MERVLAIFIYLFVLIFNMIKKEVKTKETDEELIKEAEIVLEKLRRVFFL